MYERDFEKIHKNNACQPGWFTQTNVTSRRYPYHHCWKNCKPGYRVHTSSDGNGNAYTCISESCKKKPGVSLIEGPDFCAYSPISRQSNRKPNPAPNPPKSFNRTIVNLMSFEKPCLSWETEETFSKEEIVCRQKCPPGYGTSLTECVWEKSFTPAFRRNLAETSPYKTVCSNDLKPILAQVKNQTNPVKVQLIEVSENANCRAQCPTSFGWAQAGDGKCMFKERYNRVTTPLGSPNAKVTCADTDELVQGPACTRKCASGYQANSKNLVECQWTGKKN